MRPATKLAVAALAATTLLAALTTTTSPAREFETSNQNIRVVFRPLILTASNGDTVSCTVTLEGSFHYRDHTRAIIDTPTCRSSPAIGITIAVLTETPAVALATTALPAAIAAAAASPRNSKAVTQTTRVVFMP